MRLCSRHLVFACFMALAFSDAAIAAAPPLTMEEERQIREALCWGCLDDPEELKKYHYLLRVGEKAYPIYEAILSDPKVTPEAVTKVYLLIDGEKPGARRFREYAVTHLTHADPGIRADALILLKDIGSSVEASPAVALLSDEDVSVRYAAARTLAAIGGSREVVAMDAWLRGVTYRDKVEFRQHVKKCRDELKRRLDEARVKAQTKSRPAAPSTQQR